MCSDFPTFWLCQKKKTKETRYFVERDRNRRKMAKTNKHETNRFCEEKGMNDYKKGKKQGDTQRK